MNISEDYAKNNYNDHAYIAIYNNNVGSTNKYMICEFNTGMIKGFIKAVTSPYTTIKELLNDYCIHRDDVPFVQNLIVHRNL